MGSKAGGQLTTGRFYVRGVHAANAGDFPSAERAYRRAVAAAPSFAEAHTNLGTTLQMLGRLDEAEASYRTAISIAASNVNAHANLGSVLCALGRLGEAHACYLRAVEVDPTKAYVHAGLGVVLYAQGRYTAAADSLRRGIELAPAWAEPRRHLGLTWLSLGEYAAAARACRAALAIDGLDAVARSTLGLALQGQGELKAAAVELARAVELEPSWGAAHHNLGIVFDRLGHLEAAAGCFHAAIEREPENLPAQLNLAGCMRRLGRLDEAAVGYGKVLEIDPDEPNARHIAAALAGEATPSAPAEYVRALFDKNAASFDGHLRTLDYEVPAMLRRAIDRTGVTALPRVLDLGCGTGLVGAELHELAGVLCGVDLSPGMIDEARRKGIYDHLHVCDVVEYLRRATDLFDAATAGDVLVYIGDISPLLAALHARLRAGAVFAFSVEAGKGSDFQLTKTGRYTHGDAYVEKAALDNQFAVTSRETAVVRQESGQPVEGHIFVLRRI